VAADGSNSIAETARRRMKEPYRAN